MGYEDHNRRIAVNHLADADARLRWPADDIPTATAHALIAIGHELEAINTTLDRLANNPVDLPDPGITGEPGSPGRRRR